jgi:CheY-like chemotaxis protein
LSANQPISEEQKEVCKPLVLVVDDDYVHRKLMELQANRLDIKVLCVSCCSGALAEMELFSFDLILMDYRMPDIDGCECTRRIRELANQVAKKIPIIAVTACVLPEDEQHCFDAGMDDYLMKPFTLEQMHEKVSAWLPRFDFS